MNQAFVELSECFCSEETRMVPIEIPFALTLAAAVGLAGCSPSRAAPPPASAQAAGTSSAAPARHQPLPAPAFIGPHGQVSIADVIEKALPSVVSISSTKVLKAPPTMQDPFFRRFFGPGWETPRERREQGLGSGVVIAPGIVATNNHVIADAEEIKVTTPAKREYLAKVVGTDPKSDLAVLKIEGDSSALKPIEFGDSSQLRLGDVVLAIGNPFGVGQTVTMGIVSAKGRADLGIVDYEDFIQTDAAINRGNSGGALVNTEGKLVGINTAILSRSGGYMGIGFAIPTNMAKPIVDALLAHGKVTRGWLGVTIQDIDQDLAKAMSLPTTSGVLISDVQPTGPAAKAGLQRGDIVVSINGQATDSTGRLRNIIAAAGSASKVKLEVLRGGTRQSFDVALGETPADAGAAAPGAPGTIEKGLLDGLALEPLTPETRKRFQLPAQLQQGLVVTAITPGSRAMLAGLRPGDVILEVNRQRVANLQTFKDAYARSKKNALLLLYRDGGTIYVVVKRE
jgi:serine protease Do